MCTCEPGAELPGPHPPWACRQRDDNWDEWSDGLTHRGIVARFKVEQAIRESQVDVPPGDVQQLAWNIVTNLYDLLPGDCFEQAVTSITGGVADGGDDPWGPFVGDADVGHYWERDW